MSSFHVRSSMISCALLVALVGGCEAESISGKATGGGGSTAGPATTTTDAVSTTDAASTVAATSSGTGGPSCDGAFTGAYGACLESHCCAEVIDCAGADGCLDCVSDPSCELDAAGEALLDCGGAHCDSQCFGGSGGSGGGTPTPICSAASGPFQIVSDVPLGPESKTAGYSAFDNELWVFNATGNPAHVVSYATASVVNGQLTIVHDESIYDQGPTLSLLKLSNDYPWRLVQNPTKISIFAGSDANLSSETWNLTGLAVGDSLTSAVAGEFGDEYAYVRRGDSLYERKKGTNTWGFVLPLTGAGTSAPSGLAVQRTASGIRQVYARATIDALGQTGVVQQSWPTSAPGNAGPPVLVSTDTDLVPIGVEWTGCELYALRSDASGVDLVVLHRDP